MTANKITINSVLHLCKNTIKWRRETGSDKGPFELFVSQERFLKRGKQLQRQLFHFWFAGNER